MPLAVIEILTPPIRIYQVDTTAGAGRVNKNTRGVDPIFFKDRADVVTGIVSANMPDERGGISQSGISPARITTSLPRHIQVVSKICLDRKVNFITLQVDVGIDTNIPNHYDTRCFQFQLNSPGTSIHPQRW